MLERSIARDRPVTWKQRGIEIPYHDRVQQQYVFHPTLRKWDEPSGIEMLKRRIGEGKCDEGTSRRLLRCVAFMGGNMNMRRPSDGDAFSKGRPEMSESDSDTITRTHSIASDKKLCFSLGVGANFVTPL